METDVTQRQTLPNSDPAGRQLAQFDQAMNALGKLARVPPASLPACDDLEQAGFQALAKVLAAPLDTSVLPTAEQILWRIVQGFHPHMTGFVEQAQTRASSAAELYSFTLAAQLISFLALLKTLNRLDGGAAAVQRGQLPATQSERDQWQALAAQMRLLGDMCRDDANTAAAGDLAGDLGRDIGRWARTASAQALGLAGADTRTMSMARVFGPDREKRGAGELWHLFTGWTVGVGTLLDGMANATRS